jgi:hypothetical protein
MLKSLFELIEELNSPASIDPVSITSRENHK